MPLLRQAMAFGIVGIGNGIVTYLLIVMMLHLTEWPEPMVNLIGYVAGLIHSYFWNRTWTFGFTGRWLRSAQRFLLSFAAAYLANLALVLLLRGAEVNVYLAHAAGMPVYTLVFFLLARFYAFPADSNRNSV